MLMQTQFLTISEHHVPLISIVSAFNKLKDKMICDIATDITYFEPRTFF